MKHDKSVRITVTIIGSVSVIAGLALIFTDGDFHESFTAIFLGVSLIGSTIFYDFRQPIDEN